MFCYGQRQQLIDFWLLNHGVDELVVHQIQPVNLTVVGQAFSMTFTETDQVIDARVVTQSGDVGFHLAPCRSKKLEALLPINARSTLAPFALPLLHIIEAALNRLMFRPPHRPRSVETTM